MVETQSKHFIKMLRVVILISFRCFLFFKTVIGLIASDTMCQPWHFKVFLEVLQHYYNTLSKRIKYKR